MKVGWKFFVFIEFKNTKRTAVLEGRKSQVQSWMGNFHMHRQNSGLEITIWTSEERFEPHKYIWEVPVVRNMVVGNKFA